MRLIELAAVAAFLGGCGLGFRALWARSRPVARWEPFHRFEGDRRRVYVRCGDELEPVGAVAADDAEYDESFLALMDRARERAAVLNSER